MIQAHVPAEMHEVGKKHREENLHYSQMPNGLKEMPCTVADVCDRADFHAGTNTHGGIISSHYIYINLNSFSYN